MVVQKDGSYYNTQDGLKATVGTYNNEPFQVHLSYGRYVRFDGESLYTGSFYKGSDLVNEGLTVKVKGSMQQAFEDLVNVLRKDGSVVSSSLTSMMFNDATVKSLMQG